MSENNPNEPEGPGRSGREKTGRARTGRLSSLTMLLLAACLVQFILLAAVILGRRQIPEAHPVAVGGSTEPYFRGDPGPWGNLEYARISLEPPDEFIPADANFFGPTHWLFQGFTAATLKTFFARCGLPAAQLAELSNPATWSEQSYGVLVTPDDALVLGLDATARQRIYAELAKCQANTLHLWPFKCRTTSFDAWFGAAGLGGDTLALLKKLAYQRGEFLCFSDITVVYPRLASNDERRRLMKWLARTSTLLMKLQVKPDSNVEALADYWAQGHRRKDIEALLDSLTNIPGGMTIDVAHLLPPFARKYLYTFPLPPTDLAGHWPDCNWSSFNFFRDTPDDRYYDFDYCGDELVRNYTKVRQAAFGDLVVFYRPDGYPIHVVVYIADDIVFTKNGNSTFHPWTLMKLNDLISDYTLDYSPLYIIFHPKQQME